MSSTSLHYWNEKLPKTQPRLLKFVYNITGAGAISSVVSGIPVYHTFGAIAAQSTIDDFLGSTNEFLIDKFDATAMGVDAVAFIIDMQGQAAKCLQAKIRMYGSDGALDVEEQMQFSTLTASTLETKAELSSAGNIALRGVITGLDALGAGTIEVEVEWIAK